MNEETERLREKIAEMLWRWEDKSLYSGWNYLVGKAFQSIPEKTQWLFLNRANKIRALYPDVEEIRKEAKREEREEIFKEIENEVHLIYVPPEGEPIDHGILLKPHKLQALKKGK